MPTLYKNGIKIAGTNSIAISQSTGISTTDVMSQNAVTTALNTKQAKLPNAPSAGKVLISTNTVGGVEWSNSPGLVAEIAKYIPWVVSTSGRRFLRNEANTGTIMEWNDNGTTKYTTIFDAQYRTKKQFEIGNHELNLPTFQNTGNVGDVWGRQSADTYKDVILNIEPQCNQDDRTNAAATTAIINTVEEGTDIAATYVRELTSLNPSGCDLPTINCLSRIFADAVILDSMDPTLSMYSEYALTSWQSGGDWQTWSSSWYGDYDDQHDYGALGISDQGYVSVYDDSYSYCVIPVLDVANPEE